jgi:aryl-alcohol dehydrogenase-like predicted oxidoreductase
LRQGSKLVACAAAGSAIGAARGEEARETSGTKPPADPGQGAAAEASRILNHNPKMGYRRLGKTGLLISEISLGGHGAAGYDESAVKNRAAVLERAAELGMNYLDTNIVEECELYGKALGDKRKSWHIGFGSWPEKLTTEWEEHLSTESFVREIEGRLRHYKTDMLDIWRPVGATWGDGQTQIATMLMISRRVLDMVVEAFEKVQKQGKVRWLGISAHNPKVFRLVLDEYPQFSVIIFPYLFFSKELGGDSLLALAKEKDVGVIGLKPFAAGTTFGLKPRQIEGRVDPRAHVLLKEMLEEPRIAAVIPGVTVPEQLDENVRGSYERGAPRAPKDEQALRECTESYHAHLTPEYSWLRDWERV